MHMSAWFIKIPIVFCQPVSQRGLIYSDSSIELFPPQIISPTHYGTHVTSCGYSYSLRGACALLCTLWTATYCTRPSESHRVIQFKLGPSTNATI